MTLSEYIAKRGLSVREFAKLANVPASVVSRVMNGATPSLPNALKIEKAAKGEVTVKEMVLA